MELEFLKEGSPDCPLIRIYGIDQAEFSSFHGAVQQLTDAAGKKCSVQEIPGFHAVDDCALTMISVSSNAGVRQIGKALRFEWALTPAKWSIVAGLVEPFAFDLMVGTHQWLSGKEAHFGLDLGTISLLVAGSADGRW
jgi:hypothetical protein